MIQESFRNLKIDVDTILQFHFWRAMNDTMQNQFINITNKNKPSLTDINTHMYEAADRYSSITKKYKQKSETKETSPKTNTTSPKPKSTYVAATNVKIAEKSKPKPNFKPCSVSLTKHLLKN